MPAQSKAYHHYLAIFCSRDGVLGTLPWQLTRMGSVLYIQPFVTMTGIELHIHLDRQQPGGNCMAFIYPSTSLYIIHYSIID